MKTVIYSLITILLLSCSGDNVPNTNTPDDNSGLSNLLDSANTEISKLGESVTEKDGLIESITQDYTNVLESYINKYPEQYFWFHNRWKTIPQK